MGVRLGRVDFKNWQRKIRLWGTVEKWKREVRKSLQVNNGDFRETKTRIRG